MSARVVLGVGGGIAAYKAAAILRLLTESGADVTVIPTAAALRFVGAPTWEALSGHPVTTTVWESVAEVRHVALGQQADLVLVAPTTADLLARAAAGLADDLLTTTLLATRAPVLLAPAMHTEMWLHAATQANVATLRGRGVTVLDPAVGRLTGADTGPGRLPDPEQIVAAAHRLLAGGGQAQSLAGRRVLVSAGGTREPLDPVRFLGNRSSGRQGYALAEAATARGAVVTVVSANVALPAPPGATLIEVGTAAELHDQMRTCQPSADIVIMSAAVADFRPVTTSDVKLKKGGAGEPTRIELERTADVLVDLVAHRPSGQLIVGFAAETGDQTADVLTHARHKLARKGCDVLVVNDVAGGAVFGEPDNEVTVLTADGAERRLPRGDKRQVAEALWDVLAAELPAPAAPAAQVP